MALRGADSTTASLLPHGLDVYCPYRDGLYANEALVRRLFPGKIILPITVRNGRAPCDDIEPGNGTSSDAPGYWEREHVEPESDGMPWFYAARAQMVEIIIDLQRAGIPRSKCRFWVAHPNGIPHICSSRCFPGLPDDIEGTQYAWNPGGVNIDLSLFRDDAFGPMAPPTPPPPYMSLVDKTYVLYGRHLNERSVYRHANGALQHPDKHSQYLHRLYKDLKLLRDRITRVAKLLDPLPNGDASWAKYGRGLRWQMLNGKMKQIAKAVA